MTREECQNALDDFTDLAVKSINQKITTFDEEMNLIKSELVLQKLIREYFEETEFITFNSTEVFKTIVCNKCNHRYFSTKMDELESLNYCPKCGRKIKIRGVNMV